MSSALPNDLERTDVLPQLDAAAYEAADDSDAVETDVGDTSSWSVPELRVTDAQESAESTELRERIEELESELAAAQRALENHDDLIVTHAELRRQLEAQRTQAVQVGPAGAAQLAGVNSGELAQLQLRLRQALQAQADTERQLQQTTLLLAERDQTVTSLRAAHIEQERAASHLARLLAGKMSEQQTLGWSREKHEEELKGLRQTVSRLREELQQSQSGHVQSAREMAATARALADALLAADRNEQLVRERDEVIARLRRDLANAASTPIAPAPAQDAVLDLQQRMESLRAENAQLTAALAHAETPRPEQSLAHVPEATQEAHDVQVAALQAEIQRQSRNHEELERAIRVRDDLLHTLRGELQSAQEERGILGLQMQKARRRMTDMAERLLAKDARIAALKSGYVDLAEGRTDDQAPQPADPSLERVLEPIDHDGAIVALDRKIMTVGRTEESDVCVPSRLVSRNHARLLVGSHAVIVIDAGSTNGCFVNDRPVKKETVREGDVLRFGNRAYRVITRTRPVARTAAESPSAT